MRRALFFVMVVAGVLGAVVLWAARRGVAFLLAAGLLCGASPLLACMWDGSVDPGGLALHPSASVSVPPNPVTLALLAPPPADTPAVPPSAPEVAEGMTLRLSAGGQGILTGEPGNALTPFARLEVAAPLPILPERSSQWWPTLEITGDFTGLPGQEAVDVTRLDTYKALEMEIGVVQPIFHGGHQRISIGLVGGFATRFPGRTEPRDKTARWGQVLAEIAQTEGAAYLRVGLGGDQRLDGDYRLVTIVEGSVRLWREDKGALRNVEVRLVGDAILGLAVAGFAPSRRDVVRVALSLSR